MQVCCRVVSFFRPIFEAAQKGQMVLYAYFKNGRSRNYKPMLCIIKKV